MKKKFILLSISVCVLLSGSLIYFSKDNIENYLWRKIDNRLDYERSLKVGDNFNKISWGDLSFQINHNKDGNNLEYVNAENEKKHILLNNISSYKILNGYLYVKAPSGYAIIDGNNFCRIYTDCFNDEQSNNHDSNKVHDSQMLKFEKIEYLSDFNEFDENEQKIFKKLY